MRKIATLLALLTFTTGAWAEEITIRYIRPSTLITYFAEFQRADSSPFYGKTLTLRESPNAILGRLEGAEIGLVPKGVTLVAHDSKGVLEMTGPADGIAKVKTFVALFDIAPQRVSLSLESSCKTLNADTQTKTVLLNNKKWSMEDELLRLRMTIATRVNSDATITMTVEVSRGKTTTQTMTFRVKDGESVKFYVNDTVAIMSGDGKPEKTLGDSQSKGDIDEPEVVLTLRAGIVGSSLASVSKKH